MDTRTVVRYLFILIKQLVDVFDNIRIKQDCYLNRMVNLPGRLSIFTFWFVISYMLINYIINKLVTY